MNRITRTGGKPVRHAVRSTDVFTERTDNGRPRVVGALFGVLAAAAAVGTGEFVAAFTGAATAPELAVGTALINLAPVSAKDFAVRTFGTNDKLVLVGGVLAVLVVVAAVAGVLALRRAWLGIGIVAAFGVLGMIAAATAPVASITSVVPSLCAAIAGTAALAVLLRTRTTSTSRRAVLKAGLAVAVIAATTAISGRVIASS
jgi:hypothetical protein